MKTNICREFANSRFAGTSLLPAALAATLLTMGSVAQAEGNSMNLDVLLGSKQLNSDWENINGEDYNEQGSMMVMFDVQPDAFPVALAADLLMAGNQRNDVEAATIEWQLGPRWNIDTGTGFKPYLGAGLSLAGVSIKHDDQDFKDREESGHGWWAGIGARYDISGHWHMVADVRHSRVDVDVDSFTGAGKQDFNAGGTNIAIGAGYHW